MKLISSLSLLLISMTVFTVNQVLAQDQNVEVQLEAVTPATVMHFRSLKRPVISANGEVMAVEVAPDRGDSYGLVRSLDKTTKYIVKGGTQPQISHDGRFVSFQVKPSLLTIETASEKAKKKLTESLTLLDTKTGKQSHFKRVKSSTFNESGTYLAIRYEKDSDKSKKEASKTNKDDGALDKELSDSRVVDKFDEGDRLTLVELRSGKQQHFNHVTGYKFDQLGRYAVIAINDQQNDIHQIKLVSLSQAESSQTNTRTLYQSSDKQIGDIAIREDGVAIAFVEGDSQQEPYGREYQLAQLEIETAKVSRVANSKKWLLNRYTELEYSKDNQRLFFGRVPYIAQQVARQQVATESDLYNTDIVTDQRGLTIWHGDDARIKPNEIKKYSKELKRTYLAVLHLTDNRIVQLADEIMPDIELQQQSRFVLGSSDIPYRKMSTWAGFYRDFYIVDLNTGQRTPLVIQLPRSERPSLSPNQKYVIYYQQGELFLYHIAQQRRINLSDRVDTSFADEDHDYPSPAPSYSFGPWLADSSGFLVYDKYDVWQFNTESFDGFMLSRGEGRKQKIKLRVAGLPEDKKSPTRVTQDQALLLHGYSEQTKADGFYRVQVGLSWLMPLLEGAHKIKPLVTSKEGNKFIFSKERYDLFPDLYASDIDAPQHAVQLTQLETQKENLQWGTSELVQWTNGDGTPLDGVLIKPANYIEGKRYPVLVYFYRFMSDRLHAFPQMRLNHRPNFAWYASQGYAIFLPDIRFEVGYPGATSVQALTSGVQKLIDMGIADPDAVGIQGHSWGGYQTAFAVTQTHIFKAAVTGAPVSNMTSAYSGIRHGSGLARQFQYETGQSRIGKSLFDAPQKYIENSPVFYVERIKTPMMIMFGDKDDAVPWEQGVELYLAMRRVGKDVVFLQYKDEPHHLKKYPNKLDYSLRMMAYFDHYLKGKPAPRWLTQGEAYQKYRKAD